MSFLSLVNGVTGVTDARTRARAHMRRRRARTHAGAYARGVAVTAVTAVTDCEFVLHVSELAGDRWLM